MPPRKRARLAAEAGVRTTTTARTEKGMMRLARDGPHAMPVIMDTKTTYKRLRFKLLHDDLTHLSVDFVVDTEADAPWSVYGSANVIHNAEVAARKPVTSTEGITTGACVPIGRSGTAWPANWMDAIRVRAIPLAIQGIEISNISRGVSKSPYVRKLFTAHGVDPHSDAGTCIVSVEGAARGLDDMSCPADLKMDHFLTPCATITSAIDTGAVRDGRACIRVTDKPGDRAVAALDKTPCLDWKEGWVDIAKRHMMTM